MILFDCRCSALFLCSSFSPSLCHFFPLFIFFCFRLLFHQLPWTVSLNEQILWNGTYVFFVCLDSDIKAFDRCLKFFFLLLSSKKEYICTKSVCVVCTWWRYTPNIPLHLFKFSFSMQMQSILWFMFFCYVNSLLSWASFFLIFSDFNWNIVAFPLYNFRHNSPQCLCIFAEWKEKITHLFAMAL